MSTQTNTNLVRAMCGLLPVVGVLVAFLVLHPPHCADHTGFPTAATVTVDHGGDCESPVSPSVCTHFAPRTNDNGPVNALPRPVHNGFACDGAPAHSPGDLATPPPPGGDLLLALCVSRR